MEYEWGQLTTACPQQFIIAFDNNVVAYLRIRGGHLSVHPAKDNESADMWYDNDGESIAGRPEVRHCSFIGLASMNIPCWSLAALLETLPLEVETHKQTDGHKIYYYVESYMKRMEKEIYLSSERYENLVDACYEMILKLNEQNLL